MNITTKLVLAAFTAIILSFSIGLSVFISARQIDKSVSDGQKAYSIVKEVFWSDNILSVYVLYRHERAQFQWQLKHQAIAVLLKSQNYTNPKDQRVLESLRKSHIKAGEIFSELVRVYKNGVSEEREEQLANSLLAISQSMVSESVLLSDSNFAQREIIRRNRDVIIAGLIGILTFSSVGFIIFLLRSVIGPTAKLQKGLENISVGNLDIKIDIKSHDEIGQLAGALNYMAQNLKESYGKLLLEQQNLQKFKLAVEDAYDHIIIADNEGTVVYANPAAEKITGFLRSEIIGKKAGSLWGGLMDKAFYENMWKTIKVEKKIFIGNITNRRKNGQQYESEIHISPILDGKGEPIFFVAIERDITREKAINKAKSEFVSIASHQLRTPLGIIKWYLEALQSNKYLEAAPQEVKDNIKEIYRSNERVLTLVRALLSVSRIDQGRVKDGPKPVDIVEMIKETVKTAQILADKKSITLNIILPAQKVPLIQIDPLRLREVLDNLVVNAVKYTPISGKVEISLTKPDGIYVINVKDTGIGISDDDRKKLFTKFFRSEKAVETNPEGSGLGLYVVKSYVEGWGGTVKVESAEGKGSNFTIILPVATAKTVGRSESVPGEGVKY